MIIRELCPNCNGRLVPFGDGKLKCECCHSVFDDSSIPDEEKSLLIAASKLLRDGKFDDADEAYRDIISTNPRNHEAYYGRALAKHGIVFVSDIRAGAGKKVPTCYITDVGSFVEDVNFKKAVEFAPDDVKAEYVNQGNLIENIITEWKEKASKEEYDVFISFKASEDETGEETKDAVEAAKLYSFLVSNHYKVFFAPVTLKAYTSERYEPYIFNALNQAPVMIVYGQSQEHMEATWVRNEWSRFIKKIQNGEKQPNSLVVIYEKMTARDLPSEFKNIQCMDGNEHTCYVDLVKHINKVLESSKQPVSSIDTIQTEYGKVGKKATTMNYKQVKTYSLGTATIQKVTETDETILEGARKYFDHDMIEECLRNLDQFLKQNEYHYGANLLRLYAIHNCKTIDGLVNSATSKKDIDEIKFLITLASKDDALSIIDILYKKFNKCLVSGNYFWKDIFAVLVELDFPKNAEMRINLIEKIIENKSYNYLFDDYIRYVDNNNIDYHISARVKLISNYINNNEEDVCRKYINEVLEIDEGNIDCAFYKMCLDLSAQNSHHSIIQKAISRQEVFINDLENLFKFSQKKDNEKNTKIFLNELLEFIRTSNYEYCHVVETQGKIQDKELLDKFNKTKAALKEKGVEVDFFTFLIGSSLTLFDKLIRYVPTKNAKSIVELLDDLTKILYDYNLFDTCISYCNILYNYAEDDYKDNVIYLILRCKARYSESNKYGIYAVKEKINSFDEWEILMNYKGTDVETDLFDLLDKQNKAASHLEDMKATKEFQTSKKDKYTERAKKLEKKANTSSLISSLIISTIITIICGAIFFGLYELNLAHELAAKNLINCLYPFTLFAMLIYSLSLDNKKNKKIIRDIPILGFVIFILGMIAHIVCYNVVRERFAISRTANLWLSTAYVLMLALFIGVCFFVKAGKKKQSVASDEYDGIRRARGVLETIEYEIKDIDSCVKQVEFAIKEGQTIIEVKNYMEENL